jgi:hypothetical protein
MHINHIPEHFQVAISFSEDSSSLAEDLHDFLIEQGISCYFYKKYSDRTRGFLRDKIERIYTNSDLNVMIWSEEYRTKDEDAVVSIEKQTIYDRHLKGNQADQLYILLNDLNVKNEIKVSNKFSSITYHSLSKTGLFHVRNAIIERLFDCYSIIDTQTNTKITHPRLEYLNRGALSFCKFRITKLHDRDKRWVELADIKVEMTYCSAHLTNDDAVVYLIPSGRVTNLISHSTILKTQKMSRDLKRKISSNFVKNNINKEFTGYFFYIFAHDLNLPHVYSVQYDNFINEQLLAK